MILDLDERPGEIERRLADEHLAGRRLALDARRQVRGLADDVVRLDLAAPTHVGHDREPGVDADADRQPLGPRVTTGPQAQRLDRGHHLVPGERGPYGVVLVSHGKPK